MFNVVQDVMCATGPVFLWGHNISTDYLSYSSITEGDWKWGINDLNYESARQSATRPSYVLKYGRGKVANEQEVRGKFDDDCNDYRKHLAMYLYSKKFGDKHPLNIVLKQHLELSYPYKKDSFKKLLQANFESYQNILQKYEIKLVDNLDNIENSPHNIIYVSRFDHKNINLLVIHDQDSQSKLKLELIIKILSSGRLSPESVSAILAALKKENITIETTVPGLTELAWKEKVCAALKLDDRHFCVLNTLLDKAGIKFEDPEILSPDKQSSYGLNM